MEATHHQTAHLSVTSPFHNFGAGVFGRRVLHAHDGNSDRISAVYEQVVNQARTANCSHVVALYPALSTSAQDILAASGLSVTALTRSGTLAMLQSSSTGVTWHACEPWSASDVSAVFGRIASSAPTFFVCVDVLTRVEDPRWLLREIRTQLCAHPKSRCVLSIDTSVSSTEVLRTWTREACIRFCTAAGFIIESQDDSDGMFTAILSCSHEHYQRFLTLHGFQTTDFTKTKRLLVTAEHPRVAKSGGIGSYFQELELLVGTDIVETCYVGAFDQATPFVLSNDSILRFPLPRDESQDLLPPEIALWLVEQALFYLPAVHVIEYQDYHGIGARIVQARNAGLLPCDITLEIGCHGSILYVEAANQQWCGIEHNEHIMLEKIAIEGADTVRFPTIFLRDFYLQRGYAIDPARIIIERYPFRVTKAPHQAQPTPLERIIFVGKQSPMKGFPEFLEVVHDLVMSGSLPGLKEIICYGPTVEISPLDSSRKEALKKRIIWQERFVERDMLQAELASSAHHALAFIPYRGDNHPNVILEIINAGLPLVAFATGGIPELLPPAAHAYCLCSPMIAAAKQALVKHWKLIPGERAALAQKTLQEFAQIQQAINESIITRMSTSCAAKLSIPHLEGNQFTVIVPVFHTKLTYVSELIDTLNAQTSRPREVLFIDDASGLEYHEQLKRLIGQELQLPFRILRHEVNQGLAGARNTALQACQTPYLINIDSDDTVSHEYVATIAQAFARQPNAAAVIPYLEAFTDGTQWQKHDYSRYVYRPLGEGFIVGQLENRYGHANSGYRVEALRAIGGWNDTSRAMWEDWELFQRLVGTGAALIVIPKIVAYYRVQQKSMARTYKRFPAMERIVPIDFQLDRFEAFRLQAMLRAYADLKNHNPEYQDLLHRYKNMEAQYDRFLIRMMRGVVRFIEVTNIDYLYRKSKQLVVGSRSKDD
jgi:glycosyltransferase involved in cell wall biosynthesis